MVVAVLAVLTAIVAAAVIGVKSTGTDGQVKSDAKATQIALDNYNNKSIKARQFPEAQLDLVVSTAGASNFHINADVAGLGSGDGRSVLLVGEDGRGETLADKLTPFGKTTGDAVFKRRLIEFGSATDTWDTSGAVKTSSFVPHFLLKKTHQPDTERGRDQRPGSRQQRLRGVPVAVAGKCSRDERRKPDSAGLPPVRRPLCRACLVTRTTPTRSSPHTRKHRIHP